MAFALTVTTAETNNALKLPHQRLCNSALNSLMALRDYNTTNPSFLKQVIDMPMELLVLPEIVG
jgi:hypothetical protein